MVQKFLIIQTAFIGDVVLATSLIEKLHQHYPSAQIDFLLRKGNENLLHNNPWLEKIIIWDKKKNKLLNLFKILIKIRKEKYDKVINVQRFAATGFLTAFSGSKETIGFDKNPFSFLFNKKIKHSVVDGTHEIERNLALIKNFTDDKIIKPKLYPSEADFESVEPYKQNAYITVSPASVWFTKQYPLSKWINFIDKIPSQVIIYLCGGPADTGMCEHIISSAKHATIFNLSGKLSFLQCAALMKDAVMNYVNDSAPMHFTSAMNAPVAAVFCSTIPAFGFGPLSDKKFIIELHEPLDCRPCGLHGYKTCPRGHFHCALNIEDEQLMEALGV
ncbi:MAG TPA: glycosyltransferase family 9 protein [Puia sp.]|jgi:ADP-heptose:LPS heptosyltransferase|nr:glycosyltransferase family 9 protein [Puia sp.]